MKTAFTGKRSLFTLLASYVICTVGYWSMYRAPQSFLDFVLLGLFSYIGYYLMHAIGNGVKKLGPKREEKWQQAENDFAKAKQLSRWAAEILRQDSTNTNYDNHKTQNPLKDAVKQAEEWIEDRYPKTFKSFFQYAQNHDDTKYIIGLSGKRELRLAQNVIDYLKSLYENYTVLSDIKKNKLDNLNGKTDYLQECSSLIDKLKDDSKDSSQLYDYDLLSMLIEDCNKDINTEKEHYQKIDYHDAGKVGADYLIKEYQVASQRYHRVIPEKMRIIDRLIHLRQSDRLKDIENNKIANQFLEQFQKIKPAQLAKIRQATTDISQYQKILLQKLKEQSTQKNSLNTNDIAELENKVNRLISLYDERQETLDLYLKKTRWLVGKFFVEIKPYWRTIKNSIDNHNNHIEALIMSLDNHLLTCQNCNYEFINQTISQLINDPLFDSLRK